LKVVAPASRRILRAENHVTAAHLLLFVVGADRFGVLAGQARDNALLLRLSEGVVEVDPPIVPGDDAEIDERQNADQALEPRPGASDAEDSPLAPIGSDDPDALGAGAEALPLIGPNVLPPQQAAVRPWLKDGHSLAAVGGPLQTAHHEAENQGPFDDLLSDIVGHHLPPARG